MDKTNNLKHLLLLVVLALAGFFTASCSKDDETNDSPKGCEAIDELVGNVENGMVPKALKWVGAVFVTTIRVSMSRERKSNCRPASIGATSAVLTFLLTMSCYARTTR